ncbi:MAG: glycerol-3-phosphate 1-O-acyltransferase PlsY [Candidatus Hydrogenedentes bacterium]|nr:glycerol-3-phosphate 1-O-acyltransferase PlsY [Candidatus Hydrogenedentota bacterium]
MLATVLAIVASYVLGSVPTGLWLGLWLRKVDIREHGSKNIGATNTMRVLGKGLGATALAGDALKGLIPVLFVSRLSDWPYAALACGIAAILGHLASVFLRFKGGKGVATSLGVFLALCPLPTLAAAVTFFVLVFATRMVSVGSIGGAIAMTAGVYLIPHDVATAPTHLMPGGWALRIVVTIVALLVIVKHRANIGRIIRGEESKVFSKELK